MGIQRTSIAFDDKHRQMLHEIADHRRWRIKTLFEYLLEKEYAELFPDRANATQDVSQGASNSNDADPNRVRSE